MSTIKRKVEMFVVSHKDLFVPIPEGYKVIGVGKYGRENQNKVLSDSTKMNISQKNQNYCELTAIYWLWKNYELPEYVGICHYRRFFVKGLFSKIYDVESIQKIMENKDVILPHKTKEEPNVWKYFANSKSGREEDLVSLENLIKENYPDYHEAFLEVMYSKATSFCNMAVMKKEDFCQYCSWLFELLNEYEKRVCLDGYTKQEQRIYGFMSEFLLNVWVLKHNKRVKYVSAMLFEENKIKNTLKKVKIQLKNVWRIIRNYDKR